MQGKNSNEVVTPWSQLYVLGLSPSSQQRGNVSQRDVTVSKGKAGQTTARKLEVELRSDMTASDDSLA